MKKGMVILMVLLLFVSNTVLAEGDSSASTLVEMLNSLYGIDEGLEVSTYTITFKEWASENITNILATYTDEYSIPFEFETVSVENEAINAIRVNTSNHLVMDYISRYFWYYGESMESIEDLPSIKYEDALEELSILVSSFGLHIGNPSLVVVCDDEALQYALDAMKQNGINPPASAFLSNEFYYIAAPVLFDGTKCVEESIKNEDGVNWPGTGVSAIIDGSGISQISIVNTIRSVEKEEDGIPVQSFSDVYSLLYEKSESFTSPVAVSDVRFQYAFKHIDFSNKFEMIPTWCFYDQDMLPYLCYDARTGEEIFHIAH